MKKLMLALAAACCLIASARAGLAQQWPQQPIHIIVAFGPGGGADIIGRILADAMQERLGKPVIVENKPGAGGILGNELVANAIAHGFPDARGGAIRIELERLAADRAALTREFSSEDAGPACVRTGA